MMTSLRYIFQVEEGKGGGEVEERREERRERKGEREKGVRWTRGRRRLEEVEW